jgi:hypothetical protein
MELFWDCIFVARILDADAGGATAAVERRPALIWVSAEYSPDGRLPNLADYENIDGPCREVDGGDYAVWRTGLLGGRMIVS